MTRRADFLAFFDEQGKKPEIDPEALVRLGLFHITVAPPVPVQRQKLEYITECVVRAKEFFADKGHLLESASDLDNSRSPKILFGLQHPPIDNMMQNLFNLGVKVTAIAYGDPNVFGSGFNDPHGHLSDIGKKFIEHCAEVGFILDLSHAGHQTARDIVQFIDRHNLDIDVVASHTGCHAVFPHNRNLPDDVLGWVTHRGGVVGLYNITFLLDAEDNSLDSYFRHLEHLLYLCGSSHVVLATDGIYKKMDYESLSALQGFEGMRKVFDPDGRLGMRLPPEPVVLNTPHKADVLYEAIKHGFGRYIAGLICGENLFRFLKTALSGPSI